MSMSERAVAVDAHVRTHTRGHTRTRAHTHSRAMCCNSADMRKLFMNVHTLAHKLIHYLRRTHADLRASSSYCARVYTLKCV